MPSSDTLLMKQAQNRTVQFLGITPMTLEGPHSDSAKQTDQYPN